MYCILSPLLQYLSVNIKSKVYIRIYMIVCIYLCDTIVECSKFVKIYLQFSMLQPSNIFIDSTLIMIIVPELMCTLVCSKISLQSLIVIIQSV